MPGFPGYMVTDDGRFFSCHRPAPGGRRIWRPLTLWRQPNDRYYRATLYLDKDTPRRVCCRSVVAAAFLGPKPPGTRLWTLDGDHANHRADNLAYLTNAEAKAHGLSARHMPRGTGHWFAALTPERVTAIRRFVHAGGTLREASRRYGTTPQNCKAVVERRTWRHVADGFPPLKVGYRKPAVRRKLSPAQIASIGGQAVTGRPARRIWMTEFKNVCCYDTVHGYWRKARLAAGLPVGGRRRRKQPCPPPTGTSA